MGATCGGKVSRTPKKDQPNIARPNATADADQRIDLERFLDSGVLATLSALNQEERTNRSNQSTDNRVDNPRSLSVWKFATGNC
jgi:hypothetical protein